MPYFFSNILPDPHYFPILIFAALLLSGINFPLSEDIIIITTALAAEARPELIIPFYTAIFFGVIISDHMAYWIGYKLGSGVTENRFFSRVFSTRKKNIVQKYLHTHGILTFIICRFIPFGVRNTLFMSSGLSRMNYKTFTFYDLIAASISTSTLFFLVYFLGISVEKPIRTVGAVLFIILIITACTIIFKLYVMWRSSHNPKDPIS